MPFTGKLILLHWPSPNFPGILWKNQTFSCVTWPMSAEDSTLFLPPPFCCPSLPSIKFKGSEMTVFTHRLINNISDLLFHHINADCIYSSDLTWMTKSCTANKLSDPVQYFRNLSSQDSLPSKFINLDIKLGDRCSLKIQMNHFYLKISASVETAALRFSLELGQAK